MEKEFKKDEFIVDGFEIKMVKVDILEEDYYGIEEMELYKNEEQVDIETISDELFEKIELMVNEIIESEKSQKEKFMDEYFDFDCELEGYFIKDKYSNNVNCVKQKYQELILNHIIKDTM